MRDTADRPTLLRSHKAPQNSYESRAATPKILKSVLLVTDWTPLTRVGNPCGAAGAGASFHVPCSALSSVCAYSIDQSLGHIRTFRRCHDVKRYSQDFTTISNDPNLPCLHDQETSLLKFTQRLQALLRPRIPLPHHATHCLELFNPCITHTLVQEALTGRHHRALSAQPAQRDGNLLWVAA